MINFSLPYSFNIHDVDEIKSIVEKSSEKINIEFYGSLNPTNFLMDGRGESELTPTVDYDTLKYNVNYIQSKGFNFNYLINAPFYNNIELTRLGYKNILNHIEYLHSELNINTFTVANIILAEIINTNFKGVDVYISTIAGIDAISQVVDLKNKKFKKVVLKENRIRDFKFLQEVANIGGIEIELILNNHCYQDCVYRDLHYLSLTSKVPVNSYNYDFFTNSCLHRNAIEFLKVPIIRPEDIDTYINIGIQNFKVEGRTNIEKSNLTKFVQAYIDRNYEGNIVELLYCFNTTFGSQYENFVIENKNLDGFLEFFIKEPYHCDLQCKYNCNYCNLYLDRIFNRTRNDNINNYVNEAYIKYGLFTEKKSFNEESVLEILEVLDKQKNGEKY